MILTNCLLPRTGATPMEKALHGLFLAAALVLVALAVRGVIGNYSPVPYMDMWDGTLGFYMRVQDGDGRAWLAQHNEHRIVLARILFWLDHRWFGGDGRLLLAANLLLLALIAALFTRFVREAADDAYRWFAWFVVGWLFLWTQWENLTWGFQSQFYFAYLLPLAALYLLHRSAEASSARSPVLFTGALACGVAALGSMANGVLTVPLMAAFAWLIGMPRRRVGLIAVVAVLGITAYFTQYTKPAATGSIGESLISDPVGVLRYVALFFGSPLFFLSGGVPGGRALAEAAGFLLMLASAAMSLIVLSRRPRSTVDVALLCFLVYIGVAAAATAGGRLKIRLEFALSSRYTTPALLAWATLAVLVLSRLKGVSRLPWNAIPLLAALCVMLPFQARAVRAANDATRFNRSLAAMALELGVRDEQVIKAVFPFVDGALQIAAKASGRDEGVFGMAPFKGARETLGLHRAAAAPGACIGHLDEVRPVPGDPAYVFVRGWLSDRSGVAAGRDPHRLFVLDGSSRVVGVLIGGQRREDVAKAVDPKALYAGFSGYVARAARSGEARLEDERAGCSLAVALPALSCSVGAPGQVTTPTVRSRDVNGGAWRGADFYRSSLTGLRVFGSFIDSDADIGAVTLRMKAGDRLLYRSGPTVGRQLFEVLGDKPLSGVLPLALDWTELRFDGSELPPEFELRLSDQGSGWGEWSAIAVLADQ